MTQALTTTELDELVANRLLQLDPGFYERFRQDQGAFIVWTVKKSGRLLAEIRIGPTVHILDGREYDLTAWLTDELDLMPECHAIWKGIEEDRDKRLRDKANSGSKQKPALSNDADPSEAATRRFVAPPKETVGQQWYSRHRAQHIADELPSMYREYEQSTSATEWRPRDIARQYGFAAATMGRYLNCLRDHGFIEATGIPLPDDIRRKNRRQQAPGITPD